MVLITIVNGVYKPTYNWGAPPCSHYLKKTIALGVNDIEPMPHLLVYQAWHGETGLHSLFTMLFPTADQRITHNNLVKSQKTPITLIEY